MSDLINNIISMNEGAIIAATSATAVEYNNDVVNQVISNLESLAGMSVDNSELQTSNVGKTVSKMEEYFKLYNEIHNSLYETIKNILQTVKGVRDEAVSM